MEQKKAKILGGALLALAVVVVFGIAYAAFTQQLEIRGGATAVSTVWDVHFENLQEVSLTGTAKQLTAPTINDGSGNTGNTSISTYSVSVTSPGDTVSYIFDVVNDGDYNVGITSAGTPANGNIITPTCTGTGDNASSDAQKVCSHLHYTLYYYDKTNHVATNTAVGTYSGTTGPSATFNSNDNNGIAAHSSKTMILTLEFEDWTTNQGQNVAGAEADLPTANVTISNLGFNIVYTQVGTSTIHNNVNNNG